MVLGHRSIDVRNFRNAPSPAAGGQQPRKLPTSKTFSFTRWPTASRALSDSPLSRGSFLRKASRRAPGAWCSTNCARTMASRPPSRSCAQLPCSGARVRMDSRHCSKHTRQCSASSASSTAPTAVQEWGLHFSVDKLPAECRHPALLKKLKRAHLSCRYCAFHGRAGHTYDLSSKTICAALEGASPGRKHAAPRTRLCSLWLPPHWRNAQSQRAGQCHQTASQASCGSSPCCLPPVQASVSATPVRWEQPGRSPLHVSIRAWSQGRLLARVQCARDTHACHADGQAWPRQQLPCWRVEPGASGQQNRWVWTHNMLEAGCGALALWSSELVCVPAPEMTTSTSPVLRRYRKSCSATAAPWCRMVSPTSKPWSVMLCTTCRPAEGSQGVHRMHAAALAQLT